MIPVRNFAKLNFKVFGIQKYKTRIKRQFRGHKINGIDLSRVLETSIRYYTTVAPYSCRLTTKKLVTCNLGVDKSTGRIIAQFFPIVKQEDSKKVNEEESINL